MEAILQRLTKFRILVSLAVLVFGLSAVNGIAQNSSVPQPADQKASAGTQESDTSAQPSAATSEVVHILVGHSVVIRTESRLKRILVGSPTVLTTTTTSPNELVVTATTPGSSSLVIWHDDGSSRIIEVFADVDVVMLRDTVGRAFPREPISVEAEEGRVVLSGTVSSQAVADQVVKMAGSFSKEVVNSLQIAELRQKQVLLKVRFAEVDRNKTVALGFNLFSLGATNTIGTVSTQQFGNMTIQGGGLGASGSGTTGPTATLSDLLNIFVFRPDINLGATIKALEQHQALQILAEPNLMAVSGEPARFLAGGEFPYPVVQGSTGGNVGSVTIQFRPFGVRLDFTGTVEDNDVIRLKVAPEVSSLDFSNAVTISGFILPAISTRRAETVIELKNGQSFGIAGLLDNRVTAQLSKVPGIGDVPILGALFRSRNMVKTNTELLVIVTPTIVDPASAPPAASPTPVMPVPFLDSPNFDKKLPGTRSH